MVSPFARSVDGMPDFGQGRRGWGLSEFTGRKSVPVARLVSTNRAGYLDERRVARYARRWFPPPVWVVERSGWFYIADGHHTAAAAIANRKRRVDARVKKV